ncbi:MAG: hypothetical protein ABI831_03635 [Betaproteobacteria bacterium]|jgi:hypothetical protein
MPSEIAINAQARLVERGDGQMRVVYDGIEFARDQLVPFHIFGVDSNPTRHSTAGAFVATFMYAKFGIDESAWPALARQFVNST